MVKFNWSSPIFGHQGDWTTISFKHCKLEMTYRVDKLQAQNWVKFDFQVKFDLEGQDRLPSKTTGTLTKVFYTFGPNLVIISWMGPRLSSGQASDWYTDTRTQRRRQRQYLNAKTGLGNKMAAILQNFVWNACPKNIGQNDLRFLTWILTRNMSKTHAILIGSCHTGSVYNQMIQQQDC